MNETIEDVLKDVGDFSKNVSTKDIAEYVRKMTHDDLRKEIDSLKIEAMNPLSVYNCGAYNYAPRYAEEAKKENLFPLGRSFLGRHKGRNKIQKEAREYIYSIMCGKKEYLEYVASIVPKKEQSEALVKG